MSSEDHPRLTPEATLDSALPLSYTQPYALPDLVPVTSISEDMHSGRTSPHDMQAPLFDTPLEDNDTKRAKLGEEGPGPFEFVDEYWGNTGMSDPVGSLNFPFPDDGAYNTPQIPGLFTTGTSTYSPHPLYSGLSQEEIVSEQASTGISSGTGSGGSRGSRSHQRSQKQKTTTRGNSPVQRGAAAAGKPSPVRRSRGGSKRGRPTSTQSHSTTAAAAAAAVKSVNGTGQQTTGTSRMTTQTFSTSTHGCAAPTGTPRAQQTSCSCRQCVGDETSSSSLSSVPPTGSTLQSTQHAPHHCHQQPQQHQHQQRPCQTPQHRQHSGPPVSIAPAPAASSATAPHSQKPGRAWTAQAQTHAQTRASGHSSASLSPPTTSSPPGKANGHGKGGGRSAVGGQAGGLRQNGAQSSLQQRNDPSMPVHQDAVRQFLDNLSTEERILMEKEGALVHRMDYVSMTRLKELKQLRRKIKNKLSAKHSRMRRKEYISALEAEKEKMSLKIQQLQSTVSQLRHENNQLRTQPSASTRGWSLSTNAASRPRPGQGACAVLIMALALSAAAPHPATRTLALKNHLTSPALANVLRPGMPANSLSLTSTQQQHLKSYFETLGIVKRLEDVGHTLSANTPIDMALVEMPASEESNSATHVPQQPQSGPLSLGTYPPQSYSSSQMAQHAPGTGSAGSTGTSSGVAPTAAGSVVPATHMAKTAAPMCTAAPTTQYPNPRVKEEEQCTTYPRPVAAGASVPRKR